MPSVNKTPNLGLNQWQGNEYPKRVDFSEDNANIDAAIGDMTIDDTMVPTGNTGLSIKILLSWLGNMIKAITGKGSWRTAPVTSIEALNTALVSHQADTVAHTINSKTISFAHDLSVAGAQAVTGVGFTPKAAILMAFAIGAAGKMSIGIAGIGYQYLLADNYSAVANSYTGDGGNSVMIIDSSANYTKGQITSFDADGLTMNWAKTGVGATGTVSVLALLLR